MGTEKERELESSATAYPFVDLVVSDLLRQTFIDALFVSPDGRSVYLHGFRYEEGLFLEVDLRTESGPFFTLPVNWVMSETYGQWAVVHADSPGEERFARLVIDREIVGPSFEDLPVQAEPYGQFQTRTLVENGRYIRSVTVIDDESSHLLTGDLTLKAGYNMTLPVEGQSITIEPSRGAGEGYPPLEDDQECSTGYPSIRSINGVPGDENGNFLLKGEACICCHDALINTGSGQCAEAGALAIRADCDACCSCEQYREVYSYIDEVYQKAKRTAERVIKVLEAYNTSSANLRLWRQIKAPRKNRISVIPTAGQYMTYQVMMENNSDFPVDPRYFDLVLSFDDAEVDPVVETAYAYNSGLKKSWVKLPESFFNKVDASTWNLRLTPDEYSDMLFGWTYLCLNFSFKFGGSERDITASLVNAAGFYPSSASVTAGLINEYTV